MVISSTHRLHGPILFHATAFSIFCLVQTILPRLYPAILGVMMVLFPLLFRRWLGEPGRCWRRLILISPMLLYHHRYIARIPLHLRYHADESAFSYVMVRCICGASALALYLRRRDAVSLGSEIGVHVYRHLRRVHHSHWLLRCFSISAR
jgi:predicted membrane-bound mannosyltransferase